MTFWLWDAPGPLRSACGADRTRAQRAARDCLASDQRHPAHRHGTTRIVLDDLRDPEKILAEASGFLNFTKPVALLLVAILHFIPDADDLHGIIAALRDALPPGSFLALSHGTADFHPANVAGPAAAYDGPRGTDRPAAAVRDHQERTRSATAPQRRREP